MRGQGRMSDFRWVFFVSARFSRVDRKGRTAVTSWLAVLAQFGCAALEHFTALHQDGALRECFVKINKGNISPSFASKIR